MSAKNTLAYVALVLLPCAALFVVNTGLKKPTGIRNAPVPLTAQQAGPRKRRAGWRRPRDPRKARDITPARRPLYARRPS